MNRIIRYALLAMALFALAFPMQATTPINSNSATVSLNYSVSQSISVSTSPASVTFPVGGGAATPITVTTSWNLGSGFNAVELFMWIGNPVALTGPTNIPTSALTFTGGQCSGSNTFHPLTDDMQHTYSANCLWGSNPSSNPYSSLDGVAITSSNLQGSLNTTVTLTLNPGNLPAGNYSGVLNFLAQAN